MKVIILNDVYTDAGQVLALRKGELVEVQQVKGDSALVRGVWISKSNTTPHVERCYRLPGAKVNIIKSYNNNKFFIKPGTYTAKTFDDNGFVELKDYPESWIPAKYFTVCPDVPAPMIKDTNPKDRAATSRLDLSLFPATARAYGALGMTEGDLKYGGYNYRVAGVKASIYYSAVNRHLDDWFNGEDADRKTGVHHLASALAGIAILIDALECEKLNDDRPPRAPYRDLLMSMEEKVKHLQSVFTNPPERATEKKG